MNMNSRSEREISPLKSKNCQLKAMGEKWLQRAWILPKVREKFLSWDESLFSCQDERITYD